LFFSNRPDVWDGSCQIERNRSILMRAIIISFFPVEESILAAKEGYAQFSGNYAPDNVDLARQPVSIG